MRNIVVLFFCVSLYGSLFAQTPSSASIMGTWKYDKEGLTFQFNADGSFTMDEEGEAARQVVEQEQRGLSESAITSVSGTYTVTGNRIDMLMLVDGEKPQGAYDIPAYERKYLAAGRAGLPEDAVTAAQARSSGLG
ncbi:MAG: hypothetical protein LBG27_04320 [Spirochaetaceae bacterium]|jgi:hypothetical protein|nr:hypothetical protein [Spirochaetaceae bacterium]